LMSRDYRMMAAWVSATGRFVSHPIACLSKKWLFSHKSRKNAFFFKAKTEFEQVYLWFLAVRFLNFRQVPLQFLARLVTTLEIIWHLIYQKYTPQGVGVWRKGIAEWWRRDRLVVAAMHRRVHAAPGYSYTFVTVPFLGMSRARVRFSENGTFLFTSVKTGLFCFLKVWQSVTKCDKRTRALVTPF
jgi:hypothetical protein